MSASENRESADMIRAGAGPRGNWTDAENLKYHELTPETHPGANAHPDGDKGRILWLHGAESL